MITRKMAMGSTWDEIERAIGWAGGAAEKWYAIDLKNHPRVSQ